MPRLRRFDSADYLEDVEMLVAYLEACGTDPDRRVLIAAHAAVWRALLRRHAPAVARRKLWVLSGVARGERAMLDGEVMTPGQARRRLRRWIGGKAGSGARRPKARLGMD